MAQKIIAGNWKMNLDIDQSVKLIKELNTEKFDSDVRIILFPPSLFIDRISKVIESNIQLGVQNFSNNDNGAYTGEISINQIMSVGAQIGLIGHSERRLYYNEKNDVLRYKVNQAVKHNFEFIFCCGEPLSVRESGDEFVFVKKQLQDSLLHLNAKQIQNSIIAYEPIWAIGTGKTASSSQAEEMHKNIRLWLKELYGLKVANSISILYGGSCNASNAKELLACPNVDGALVGGASLNSDDFSKIVQSY